MPIDPRLPLQVRDVQVMTPLEQSARVAELQGTQLEQQAKIKALRDQEAIQQVFQQHVAQGGDPTDLSPVLGKVFGINPMLGIQLQRQMEAERAAKAKAKAEAEEATLKHLDVIGKHVQSVLSLPETEQQRGYEAMLGDLSKRGILGEEELPPVFDRVALSHLAQGVRAAKQGGLHVLQNVEDPQHPGTFGTMVTDQPGFYKGKEGPPAGRNPNKEALALAAAGGDEQASAALKMLDAAGGERNPTAASLAVRAAQGDPEARKALAILGSYNDKPASEKPAKPPTGAQAKALGYFNRMKQATEDIEPIETAIAKQPVVQRSLEQSGWMPTFLKSSVGQQYEQAQRAFTEARLRKDSGAAVPEHEYENDRKTYFVSPGESKESIANKRRARKAILASLAYEAGPALAEFYGDDAAGMVTGYQGQAKKPATTPGATKGKIGPYTWEVVK